MNKALVVVLGGLVLIAMLTMTSLVAAAPPAKPPAAPAQAATATPVPADSDPLNSEASVDAEANVDPAAITPVSPGAMTSKIIVFNTDTTGAATVSIKVVDPATGASIWSTTLATTIPVNGARVVTLPTPPAIPAGFRGSAVVSSNKNVQAFVTDDNGATHQARDTYEGTAVLTGTLTLPFVRHLTLTTQHSIIAVENTASSAGNVTLHLYNPDGSEHGTPAATTVASLASAYFNTDTLFGSEAFTGTAQLQADAGVTIAGAEQTSYYLDTASFRAQDVSDQDTTLYVPFVERQKNTAGAILSWSEIYVRNDGSAPTDIKAEFYLYTGGINPRMAITRTAVIQNGLAQFPTNTSEFKPLLPSGTYFRGWAKITSLNGQPISLYSLGAQYSGRRLFGTGGVPFAQRGTKFACGDAYRIASPAQYSKIVVVNPNSTATTVKIQLYKPTTGAAAGAKTYSLGANKVWQLPLSDAAFGAAGTSFEGLAVVSSTTQPVVVIAYTQYGTGGITSFNCSRLAP